MDKAKILRLLDEADDIVSALYRQGANKDYKCKSLREKLKAIASEITAPPKTNADRIRQMTDEELAEFLMNADANICDFCDMKYPENCLSHSCEGEDCKTEILKWMKQEANDDER